MNFLMTLTAWVAYGFVVVLAIVNPGLALDRKGQARGLTERTVLTAILFPVVGGALVLLGHVSVWIGHWMLIPILTMFPVLK